MKGGVAGGSCVRVRVRGTGGGGALMNTSVTSHCDIFTAVTHQTCEEEDDGGV